MFPTTQVSGPANNPHVTHGTDQNLVVRFYFNKVHSQNFIRLNIPGDQKTEYDRPVNEKDKVRFRPQWEQFLSQQKQSNGQTPIEDMGISDAQVEHFRQFHITTVEQLVNLSDTFVTQVGMGTRELQKKAMAYLADIQGRKAVHELEEAKRHLENQNAVLQTQIIDLSKRLETLESNPGSVNVSPSAPVTVAKRRGRPPKVVQ